MKEEKLRAYPQEFNFKTKKPLKTNGASSRLGFTVLLDPMLHDQVNGKLHLTVSLILIINYLVGLDEFGSSKVDFATSNYFEGWKIHIHDPYQFPEVARKGIVIGTGSEVHIRYF